MDEKNMMNEGIAEEQDQVQNEAEQRANIAEAVKEILTSPEGGFYGFAVTLVIGFVVYTFTRNGSPVKVKTPNGTEVTVAKEEEQND